jgi:hypothetical protein
MMYVYAITPASAPQLPACGLRGERLVLVREGAVAAATGRLSRAPRPTPRNLRAHHHAVAAIADAVPAVLPARFGMLLEEHDLRDLLGSREAAFRRALHRVRGRAQMTVRFPRAMERDARRRSTDAGGLQLSGAAWLRARAHDLSRAARRAECVRLRGAVRRWARGEQVSEQAGVLSVYHLVPRSAAAAYRRAAAGIGSSTLPVLVGGPYPPFAFVPDLLTGDA